MKVIKSLLLGSAAGIAAVAAAQAADLPSRKSAPAEYVKICDAYGAGFFYIPGTDTCLRVGGYVRAEYAYSQPKNSIAIPSFKNGAAAASGNSAYLPSGVLDSTGFLGRGRVELDARTQTAWGTARTFIALRGNAVSGVYNQNYQTASTVTGGASATALTVEQAIVQFAGFTFGRTTAEIFSFLPPYNYASFSNSGFPGAINILSYTATFGGGFSATLGIEDRGGLSGYSTTPGFTPIGPAGAAIGAALGGAASATGGMIANGPYTWPALVGNVRFDQSWGAIQVMGAVVQNGAITTLANTNPAAGGSSNVVLTQTGWSIGAGLKLNLPQLAAGDHLYLTAAYGVGDLDHVLGNNTSGSPPNIGRELGGLWRQDRNLYVSPSATAGACTAATVTSACFRSEQTSAWSIAGWFTHYWTPTIRSVLLSSYAQITPGTQTRNTDWTLGGLSSANLFKIAGQLIWSPVKDLDIGAEVQYENLQQKLAATSIANGGTGIATAIPAAWGTGASSNIWQARLRVQRQF